MRTYKYSFSQIACLGLAVAFCATCSAETPPPESGPLVQTGILHLYNKQNVEVCSFVASEGQYAFQNNTGNKCPNDTIYKWRVTDGAPGALFVFRDSSKCNDSEPFFEFRLTGPAGAAITTPSDVYIPMDFTGKAPVEIIKNVMGTRIGRAGPIEGKLSCIYIGAGS